MKDKHSVDELSWVGKKLSTAHGKVEIPTSPDGHWYCPECYNEGVATRLITQEVEYGKTKVGYEYCPVNRAHFNGFGWWKGQDIDLTQTAEDVVESLLSQGLNSGSLW